MSDLKELRIRKNSILDEISSINELAVSEKRRRNQYEERRFSELQKQLDDVDRQIELERGILRSNTMCVGANHETRKVEGKMNMRKFLNSDEKNMKVELRADYLNTSAVDGVKVNPANVFEQILEGLKEVAPIVGEATVYPSVSGSLAIPKEGNNAHDAEFLAEGQRSELKKLNLDTVVLNGTRVQTAMRFTREMALNAGVDIEAFVAKKCVENLGHSLEKQAMNGYHASGFAKITDAEGVEVKEVAAITADDVMELIVGMKAQLLRGAKLVLNRATFAALKQLKAGDGNYIVQPDFLAQPVYRVLGVPVEISEFAEDNAIMLINPHEALAMLIKNDMQLQKIADDTDNVMDFTVTVVAQAVVDVKVKRAEAIKVLKIQG